MAADAVKLLLLGEGRLHEDQEAMNSGDQLLIDSKGLCKLRSWSCL